MSRLNHNPFLQFDFHSKKAEPMIFTQPIRVISTSKPDDVSKSLFEVENSLNNGYYVAGYVSYEAIYALNDSLIKGVKPTSSMPLVWFGVFKKPTPFFPYDKQDYDVRNWQLSETEQSYNQTFEKIMNKIRRQEIEQINYTVPFFADFFGDAYAYYEQLKINQKASYSAFLQIDHYQILSISPELFFQLDNRDITVKPMKGTIHRGRTYKEDMQLKKWLESSRKNKLENEMITNLMNEELSSIADRASIQVMEPYKVEAFPTVYQMTSTLRGKIKDTLSVIDVFKALFPSGSITGIPKQKSLEYIAHYEKSSRDVYCGAIGYMTPCRKAIFNVPIRTVVIDQSKSLAKFRAGGAITRHSDAHEEYTEILTKANVLHVDFETFELLETFGLHDGKYLVFEEHMERLNQSAEYFQFDIDLAPIRQKLLSIKQTYKTGKWRIRLVVHEQGKFDIEIVELTSTNQSTVTLANSPINQKNIFLYHKTTNRKIYEQHVAEVDEVFDVLLWNEHGEITEFTIGNIVVELDGKLYTPPIECGLLGGTFRARLLKEGKITERKIYKDELKKCSNIYLINSVREWVPVQLE